MRSFFTGKRIPSSFFRNRSNGNYNGLINNPNNNPNKFIQIGFMWGSFVPHTPDGHGGGCKPSWGLCGIEIGWLSRNGASSPGQASIINNRLNIYIRISDVPIMYVRYAATKVIPVQADVLLPTEMCKILGISSYLIKSGSYSFKQYDDYYHFIL